MKEKTYIVLFNDGCLHIYNPKPDKADFAKDARFFEVESQLPIELVGEWIARNYNYCKFKEI